MAARPSCLRLLVQLRRAAAARTFCTAGTSRPIRMAIIAITTSSSISVKPRGRDEIAGRMETSLGIGSAGMDLDRRQLIAAGQDGGFQLRCRGVGVARRQLVAR